MSAPESKLTPRTLQTRRAKIENLLIDAQMIVRQESGAYEKLFLDGRRTQLVGLLVEILAMLTDGWYRS